MKNSAIRTVHYCILTFGILLATNPVFSQRIYPQTLSVPVTFYDFHADSSCPEFEVNPPTDQVRSNMVGTTLDNDNKPVLGTTPFYNQMINRWFRPWTSGSTQIYNYFDEYEEGTRYDRYQHLPAGLTDVDHDTAFKNIVIEDTLTFTYIDNSQGMYEFSSDKFFPLDNQGFGIEQNEHNYSFTMEMHWTFTMVPGLRFNFTGDDDVWAFVNNQLVMDLGGIHNPATGSFNVDNLQDISPRQQVSFDLFYAERHVTGSNIRITTNIIAASAVLQLYDNPAAPGPDNLPITTLNSITAGDSVTIYGHVFDTAGQWNADNDQYIDWRIEGSDHTTLSTGKGAYTTILTDTTLSGETIVLIASFTNPDDNNAPPAEARITVHIYQPVTVPPDPVVPDPVVPDPVVPDPEQPIPLVAIEHHLDIVLDSAIARSPEVSTSQFTFTPEQYNQQLFAVVRDQNGVFIRFATDAEWKSLNTAVTTVAPLHGLYTILSKSNAAIGSRTTIIVTEGTLSPDTLQILIGGQERTAVVPNPFVPGIQSITTYLPAAVADNYRAVIDAAGSEYITMVIVEAPEPLTVLHKNGTEPKFHSYADIRIYDAVGDLIRDDCTLIAGKEKNRLTYAVSWNGTNRIGRRVGPGVYLMVIKAVRLSGQPYIIKHKIGIGSQKNAHR